MKHFVFCHLFSKSPVKISRFYVFGVMLFFIIGICSAITETRAETDVKSQTIKIMAVSGYGIAEDTETTGAFYADFPGKKM
jgi:hypothetical protein